MKPDTAGGTEITAEEWQRMCGEAGIADPDLAKSGIVPAGEDAWPKPPEPPLTPRT